MTTPALGRALLAAHCHKLAEEIDTLTARVAELEAKVADAMLIVCDLLDGRGDVTVFDRDKEMYARTCVIQTVRDPVGGKTMYRLLRQPDADGEKQP